MRQSSIGAPIISLAALASLFIFQTSSIGAEPATGPLALNNFATPTFSTPQILNKDFAENRINDSYTPLAIPCNGKVRGLALSGKAQMQKIHESGSAKLGKRTVTWQCRFDLGEGCSLVTAEQKAILVKAGKTSIFLDKGTTGVIHYTSTGRLTRCTNLTDKHQGSMHVVFGKHYQQLDPGQEIVLIPDIGQNVQEVSTQEKLGVRDLYKTKMDGYFVFLFKVSAADMIKHCKIYKQLQESPYESDHRLSAEIVKNVAALDTMSTYKVGPFPYKKPYTYLQKGGSREQMATQPVNVTQ
jgi:hypothetical protein